MLFPIAPLIFILVLVALFRLAGRSRKEGESFLRHAASVAGRLAIVRLPMLWAGLWLVHRSDWGQIAGYFLLVVNFTPELWMAAAWSRFVGARTGDPLTATIAVLCTSALLAAGWVAVTAARDRRRSAA